MNRDRIINECDNKKFKKNETDETGVMKNSVNVTGDLNCGGSYQPNREIRLRHRVGTPGGEGSQVLLLISN